jgi:hypothetical protein
MNLSFEPASNVTADRDKQLAKQVTPRHVTEAGMEIDNGDGQAENAPPSMEESREPDSNMTVERDQHS